MLNTVLRTAVQRYKADDQSLRHRAREAHGNVNRTSIRFNSHLELLHKFQIKVVEVGLRADALHHQVVGQPRVVLRVILYVRLDLRHLSINWVRHLVVIVVVMAVVR